MSDKIYSMKAKRPGSNASGRFKAPNMRDATRQALEYLANWGEGWAVILTELKNQTAALKKWNEDHPND